MNGQRQYVLLPRQGVTTDAGPAFAALTTLPHTHSTGPAAEVALSVAYAGQPVRVIDTTAENGPKLVELDEATAAAVNAPNSPLRAVPVVEYGRPDPAPRPVGGATIALAAGATGVAATVACTDAVTGTAIPDARVIAFTDFVQRIGDEGITDTSGTVTLQLASTSIERLYVYPAAGYWGALQQTLSAAGPITVALTPVDLTFVDAVRSYYGSSRFNLAANVIVGVVDTGVGPHLDLNVVGGHNTVTGEPAADYQDGDIHGTHVAGLVGANGAPPTGLRGVAPGVAIRSYRVFPGAGGGGATNYAILKALIFAAQDQCDIVNLSLGGGPYDDIVFEAIGDARNQGMFVVIAAGNDHRKPVSYPAAYPGATAVTAMGREGTWVGTLHDGDVLRPPTSTADPNEFIAAFSNMGPEIAVTGLGVGVLSTLPNNRFGPLSGTSMAAPVVAGAAASLLSQDTVVYGMPRNRARSDAIEKLLQSNCVNRGFGAIYEGYGLPDPATV
jgi:subtilisin family serine protease